MEHQLHQHFFPAGAGDGEGGGLEALMEPLCVLLYDALRPRFILLQRLEDLAELLDILQHEVPPPPPPPPSRHRAAPAGSKAAAAASLPDAQRRACIPGAPALV